MDLGVDLVSVYPSKPAPLPSLEGDQTAAAGRSMVARRGLELSWVVALDSFFPCT
jgi:hypothetical protein